MPELTLYHAPSACSKVTLNALEEAGFDYELRVLNMLNGEQKSPAYRAINPKAKIPALLSDNRLLTENAAILQYLDSLKPEAGLIPRTSDPYERATYVSDLVWCSATLHPMVRQVRMPIRFTDGDTSGVKAKGIEYFSEAGATIQSRLDNQQWWHGEQWSIVDMYLNWCYSVAALGGFDLEQFPAILRHSTDIRARAGYQRALTREKTAVEASGMELPKGLILQ